MKPLSILNTETNRKEKFSPLSSSGAVKMYSCGPTVYSLPHIGNMRTYIVTDMIRRTLTRAGYTPECVINITDVGHLVSDADEGEDKIEKQAKDEQKTVKDIVETNTDAFMNDLTLLNIPANSYSFPRATQYIQEQIEHIKVLEREGCSYKTTDGVYFDTSRFERYGALGQIENVKAGARVKRITEKRNDADFALWKFSPQGEKRQQEWDSPWGVGFPGWHMECSTMALELLGEQIDIHTGGIDHIPIHHNNEIAQSECITGKKFVKYWLHTAFLTMEGTKVSKSLGNIWTIADLVEKGYHPLSFRYFCLLTAYRTPLSFSFEALDAAQAAYETLHKIANMYDIQVDDYALNAGAAHSETIALCEEALFDNFNTPKALGHLWKLIGTDDISLIDKQATVYDLDSLFGLHLKRHEPAPPKNVLKKAQLRAEKRKDEDWPAADALRSELEQDGFAVEDTETATYIYPLLRSF